jgi:hypothetical protein
MDKIEEIQKIEYLASAEDIYHARVITSGIIEVIREGNTGMHLVLDIDTPLRMPFGFRADIPLIVSRSSCMTWEGSATKGRNGSTVLAVRSYFVILLLAVFLLL